MAFLFNHHQYIQAPCVVADSPRTGLDVGIGHQLWTKLTIGSSVGRLCLALKPAKGAYTRRFPSLICWATLEEKVEPSSIAIPRSWTKEYFPLKQSHYLLRISVVEPLALNEVVLVAQSTEAFEAANEQNSLFEAFYTEQRIIRQGDTLTLPASPLSYRFTVEATDALLQGCLKKGSTRIVVLLGEEDLSSHPDSDSEDLTDESVDGIEIDSSFLASHALSKPLPPRELLDSDPRTGPSHSFDTRGQVPFSCTSLSFIISTAEDDSTLYIRTSDLSKLGILNSDWAVVGNADTASRFRLVRVVVDDGLVDECGHVKTSPILRFNISRHEASDYSTQRIHHIQILPSPFGSHRPFIPTARAATVARIGSPVSINKQHQDAFLHGLKDYFADGLRLVKQGDLISVPIDASRPRSLLDTDEDDCFGPLALDEASFKHQIVYFMITNVEYDVLDDTSAQQSNDLYLGGRMGELGCWVDPSVTRIMQVGLEHARIPDTGTYFDPELSTPAGVLKVLEERDSLLLSPTSPFGKLLSMTSASMTKWALDCHLDLTLLLKGQRGVGKFTTMSWVAQTLGIHLMELDCYNLIGENDTKTEATLRFRFEQAAQCSPCIMVLRKLEAFAQSTQKSQGKDSPLSGVFSECIGGLQKSWKETGFPILVVGTVTEPSQVPPSILSQFKHEINFEVPDEQSRFEILTALLTSSLLSSDVSLSHLATQTAALVAADLVDLSSRARILSLERAMQDKTLSKAYVQLAGIALSASDFESALGQARDAYSESIGAPKIPSVTWDDVGGLAHVKADILDTIQLPLEHPELFADGLKKRSGILLYGPPGTGKTLIAKAVATSCSLNFFSVKGPELLNMYIGESEANVRRVFQRARDAKPCVIFFDELDSVAPKRGNHGDSGGVMDRIVSQLLAELDGMAGGEGGSDVFVIGATNRPDLLDSALLRPGRFDRMLYLGVSETHEAQFNILEALTRKFRLDADLNLQSVAEQCPFNYTGADFYALCSDAMLNAMTRKAMAIDKRISELTEEEVNSSVEGVKHPFPITPQYYLSVLATPEEIRVTVTTEDFDAALKNLVPSVSEAEMEHYRSVQQKFTQEK